VIGFSGVVFAFAGVALVRYPLTTILALVAGRVLGILRAALQTPTLEAKAQPTFSTPWWAEVAIQGHALGLFVGVLLGVWLLRRRGDSCVRLVSTTSAPAAANASAMARPMPREAPVTRATLSVSEKEEGSGDDIRSKPVNT
jgi:hypothetical protein